MFCLHASIARIIPGCCCNVPFMWIGACCTHVAIRYIKPTTPTVNLVFIIFYRVHGRLLIKPLTLFSSRIELLPIPLGAVAACMDFACRVLFHVHLYPHVLLSHQIVVHLLGMAVGSVCRPDTVVEVVAECTLGVDCYRRLG